MVWQRWTGEYLRGLRERHRLKHNGKQVVLQVGEVVLIKSDQKDCGKWRIGIVEKLFPGRHRVVRAVKLRAGNSYLERPVQHLYPLELSCDIKTTEPEVALNVSAPEFTPKRTAPKVARNRIAEIAEEDKEN